MINEVDVNELMKWEMEYSNPDLGTFISNVTESPLNVGSKAINVAESFARMVADVIPSGKQDDQWGPWVIGSRILSVGFGLISNFAIVSHKSNSPIVTSVNKWHSLWCQPPLESVPSEWKLIMEFGLDSKYDSNIHIVDGYTKTFVLELAEELKLLDDTEIISQSQNINAKYKLKRSEFPKFCIDQSAHPFSEDNNGSSSLIIFSPSREVAIIKLRNLFRVVGSTKASKDIYKQFSQNVLSIANGKVEVYKFSSAMFLQLSNYHDQKNLVQELTSKIKQHPSKLAFLAVGTPGTGKTQFSLCLSKEVLMKEGYMVIIVSINELLSFRPPNWMKKVALICNDADLLLLSRDSNKNRWGAMALGNMETCMQLLDSTLSKSLEPTRLNDTQFNHDEPSSMVYIITSNIEPENIDPALLRPGRIDVKGVFTHVYDRYDPNTMSKYPNEVLAEDDTIGYQPYSDNNMNISSPDSTMFINYSTEPLLLGDINI
jgi:hypothetical protein